MNAKTLEAITNHGKSLLAAFPQCTEKDPLALCKKLRRIETAVSRVTTDYCNGHATLEACDDACDKAKTRVSEILGDQSGTRIFINRDPRGCALKLRSEWTQTYNQTLRASFPKCCVCGCDAIVCNSIAAHSRYEQSKNKKAVEAWLSKIQVATDWGGYGILAPDLNR